jgi:hypothetical protein
MHVLGLRLYAMTSCKYLDTCPVPYRVLWFPHPQQFEVTVRERLHDAGALTGTRGNGHTCVQRHTRLLVCGDCSS